MSVHVFINIVQVNHQTALLMKWGFKVGPARLKVELSYVEMVPGLQYVKNPWLYFMLNYFVTPLDTEDKVWFD